MSFLGSSFNPLSTPGSSAQTDFKPAALSYFTIFCPALTPPKAHHDDENADSNNAWEAAQILFYTSRARAAPKERMLRQIGVAKGMVEFCNMVSCAASSSSSPERSWNVHSSKRRMVLVQVEEGIWVHASIDLPHTVRRDSVSGKAIKEYQDSLISDQWIEEGIFRAWRDWLLLNGSPAAIMARKQGRVSLERSLEKYFSVWAWSWDLEFASSIIRETGNVENGVSRNVLEECVGGFPIIPRAPRARLTRLMRSDAVKQLRTRRQLVVLSDTSILWPPSDAGCLDSENDASDDENASPTENLFDSQIRAEVLRRVVSHLTGLEKERDLVRATAVSTFSEGRKRGTSGAIRNRSTANGNSKSKRDIRTGLGKRVVSSPITQQRSTSASSSTSLTLNESTKWSNWGGMFGGLGKLTFRGGDTPERSSTPVVAEEIADKLNGTQEATEPDISITDTSTSAQSYRPVVVASSAEGNTASAEVAGPFQLIQQRLSEAMPIQEVWSGAETAFKGLGASLGLSSGSPSHEHTIASRRGSTSKEAEVYDQDRFADASYDVSTISADADASVVTKVSILEPDVDVSELAAALSTDAIETGSIAADTRIAVLEVEPPRIEAEARPQNEQIAVLAKLDEDGNGSNDSASIRTGSSAKAFPSISVTSAAWYGSKILKADTSASEASLSPRLMASEVPGSKRISFAELPSTVASDTSQTDVVMPADTSISAVSIQSEHHDFELDGWGQERPSPFQTFHCHLNQDEDGEVLSYEPSIQTLSPGKRHKVSFTTRRLLTLVLIEQETDNQESSDTLEEAWNLLRRMQRILNDHERAAKSKAADEDNSVRFLHLDSPSMTYQSTIHSAEPRMEGDVLAVAEAHCLSAMDIMNRHNVQESFSRSSSGKTWTASHQSATKSAGAKHHGLTHARPNQTFMVQTGKNISIVDCDYDLRRLSNVYPSFGI